MARAAAAIVTVMAPVAAAIVGDDSRIDRAAVELAMIIRRNAHRSAAAEIARRAGIHTGARYRSMRHWSARERHMRHPHHELSIGGA
jgi:hypothetical protein